MKVWIVLEGAYFNDHALVEAVYLTKKDSESDTRKLGFKYDKGQGFFCNEKTQMYRKIFPMPVTGKAVVDAPPTAPIGPMDMP